MKKVVIITSHFPPSNLASVHRSRLWAMYLPEFGWSPTIITCHHRYYEEKLDHTLHEMLPKWLKVIRVPAFKTKPIRLIGDAGIRSFVWIYLAVRELFKEQKFDFLLITIPSNFLAPIGMLIKKKFGVPFAIDYIDPWVHSWPGSEIIGSKAWFSRKIADFLEPISVEDADLITGINYNYYSDMLTRNPAVSHRACLAAMPYGVADTDFEYVFKNPKKNIISQFRQTKEGLNTKAWVYAGSLLPKAVDVYEAIFRAISQLKAQKRIPKEGFKLFFIGTGKTPTDKDGYQVLHLAELFSVEDLVYECPVRINYVDVLSCLKSADGILIIGSHEMHYSPSKIYQALLSGKPIWAVLHKKSAAWEFLDEKWGCEGVRIDPETSLNIENIADSFERIFKMKKDYSSERMFLHETDVHARKSAHKLAIALNTVLANN